MCEVSIGLSSTAFSDIGGDRVGRALNLLGERRLLPLEGGGQLINKQRELV